MKKKRGKPQKVKGSNRKEKYEHENIIFFLVLCALKDNRDLEEHKNLYGKCRARMITRRDLHKKKKKGKRKYEQKKDTKRQKGSHFGFDLTLDDLGYDFCHLVIFYPFHFESQGI